MNILTKKFIAIGNAIAQEKGTIRLLVLLELEEFRGRWDMVMSAEWLPESTRETLQLVLEKMKEPLNPKEFSEVARTILLRPNEPFVQSFEQFLTDNPYQREFMDIEINGLEIKRAYVIAPYIYTVEDELMELWEKHCRLQTEFQNSQKSFFPSQPLLKLPNRLEVGQRELSLSPLASPQKMSITYK
jgi:hypothetical protein